jgi:hypothetical protein
MVPPDMKRSPQRLFDRLRLRTPRLRIAPAEDSHARPARTPIDRTRVLGFMHIPKTAGSSMIGALVDALQPRHVVSGFDHILFGGFTDFASFDAGLQKRIYQAPEELPETELVVGHISYDTLRRRYPAAQFTTVLREPVVRLLSLWVFWRSHSDALLAEWGPWADNVKISRQTLEIFLHAPTIACQTDNQAVRMLLSPHHLIPASGFIEPRHDAILLAEARERLRSFAYADVLENPRFVQDWQDWLGVPMALSKLNETNPVPAPLRSNLEMEMTRQALDYLDCSTRLDLQLWRHVAGWRLTEMEAERLRTQARLRGVARYATMLAPA